MSFIITYFRVCSFKWQIRQNDDQVLGRKLNLPSVDKRKPAFFAPAGRLGAKNATHTAVAFFLYM